MVVEMVQLAKVKIVLRSALFRCVWNLLRKAHSRGFIERGYVDHVPGLGSGSFRNVLINYLLRVVSEFFAPLEWQIAALATLPTAANLLVVDV